MNQPLPTAYDAFGLAVPEQPITPTAVVPATEQTREPMVWVPGPDGNFIAVPRTLLPAGYLAPPPPVPARDLTPRPLLEPRAQVVLASGPAAAGIGWGAAQLLNAAAALGTGTAVVLALLLLAAKLPRQRGGEGGETHIHVTNHNRWWGKSSTSTRL